MAITMPTPMGHHRGHAGLTVRIPFLSTMLFIGGLFVGWVLVTVTMVRGAAAEVVSDPTLLGLARLCAVLLMVFVLADGWRLRVRAGNLGAAVATFVALLALVGVFWYLTLLRGLPGF